jgi:hypothetical protein
MEKWIATLILVFIIGYVIPACVCRALANQREIIRLLSEINEQLEAGIAKARRAE